MLSDNDLNLIRQAKKTITDTLENRCIYTHFFENLMKEVRPYSLQENDSYHGFYTHTKQVGLLALEYALSLGENPAPILIASAFHDCARLDDSYNETHALQAVPIAESFLSTIPLDKEISKKITEAISLHTVGKTAQNNIQACLWDADRTRLSWEREYEESFFNTDKGKQIASLNPVEQQKYIQKQNDFLKKNNFFQTIPMFNQDEIISFYYPSSEKKANFLYSHPSAAYTFLNDPSIPLKKVCFKRENIVYPSFFFKKSLSQPLVNTIQKNGSLLAEIPLKEPFTYSGPFETGEITKIIWDEDKKKLFLNIYSNDEQKTVLYPPNNNLLLLRTDGLTQALEKHLLDISPEYRKIYNQEMIRHIETGVAFQINYTQPQSNRLLELYKKQQGKER